ncbi:MAG: isocitrate dehydrogenase [Gemmatales bacterium]|nr:MAG: isocitrate dehydrogenase [Gemmatales bacterium]
MNVTLIHGGGDDHELVHGVKRILSAAGVDLAWREFAVADGTWSEDVLASVRETGVALKTRLKTPVGQGNVNVRIRRELGLFATVRPLRNIPGLPARFRNVDLIVIRELTEDLSAAIEHEIVPGVVQSIKVVTEAASRRLFRFAFEYADRLGRKRIHCVHKANILKLADGLFLDSFRATARDFPHIEPREIIADNCCMQLVSRPQHFDVLVTGNLYGDLISDLAAGLVGGVSATAGINYGEGLIVFEAIHDGVAAGGRADQANLLPLLLPTIELVRSIGQPQAAEAIHRAIGTALAKRQIVPADLGGTATTRQFVDAILDALNETTAPPAS